MTTEIFVFARLHARPGRQDEVHRAMFEVQGPTRAEPVRFVEVVEPHLEDHHRKLVKEMH